MTVWNRATLVAILAVCLFSAATFASATDGNAGDAKASATKATASLMNPGLLPAGKDATPAEVSHVAPTPAASTKEVPGVTFGFDERFRSEGYNNTDFNDKKLDRMRQVRFRSRPFVTFNFNQYFEGSVRIAWEGVKRTSDPQFPLSRSGAEQASPFMAGEMWFDSAYLKLKKFPGVSNLSLQAGRFDILKGDGFIFGDGSALDGSRANYFNAFDLAYAQGKSKIELIGIYDPKYDEFFPVVNALPATDPHNKSNSGSIKGAIPSLTQPGKQQNEWDESALGIYYTNRQVKSTDFDVYAFFKKDYADIRPQSNYLYLPDRHYTVIGARAVHHLARIPGLKVTSEFAYEAGTEDSMNPAYANFNIRAWGGYGYAKKTFENVKLKPFVLGGFWALSGQDPHSRTVTAFDPVFSRWPISLPSGDGPYWSEFYVYSQTPESGYGYWSNMKMGKTEAGLTPVKPITLIAGYSHLDSMEPYAMNPYHAAGSVHPAAPPAGVFATNLGRGQLFDARVIYRINKSVQGFFNVEKFFPGDFYAVQDNGYWYRFDISYRYQHFIPFYSKKN